MATNFIIKDNQALCLFGAKGLESKNVPTLFAWTNLLEMINDQKGVVFNFIFINHPVENYVGFSVKGDTDSIYATAKAYMHALEFLIRYHFEGCSYRLLNEDEYFNILNNLQNLDRIPVYLNKAEPEYLNEDHDHMRLLFARLIGSKIISDKQHLYLIQKTIHDVMNRNDDVDFFDVCCNVNFKELMKHAYLTYSFTISNKKNHSAPHISRSEVSIPKSLIYEFTQNMAVPERFCDKLIETKSVEVLFTDKEVVLVTPDIVAEFILGLK